MLTKRQEKVFRAYHFLYDRAKSREAFALEDLEKASGWSRNSVLTYISKQWGHFLDRAGKQYRVNREFLRVSEAEFLGHISQKREFYGSYHRHKYASVVTFEFLLPLKREDQVRRVLEELFFPASVTHRLEEIGLGELEKVVPRSPELTEEDFRRKLAEFVLRKFRGYTLSHVSSHSRSDLALDSIAAAGTDRPSALHWVEETKASVRFVVPCEVVQSKFEDSLASVLEAASDGQVDTAALAEEIRQIRCLFFLLFAEALVKTMRGEDEIWLLETGQIQRLYVWAKGS